MRAAPGILWRDERQDAPARTPDRAVDRVAADGPVPPRGAVRRHPAPVLGGLGHGGEYSRSSDVVKRAANGCQPPGTPTMGHNGWRLEEFQHYWGNAAFDDGGTAEVSRFLLRLYLERRDPRYNPALDRAIQFVMDSQSPIGGRQAALAAAPRPVVDGMALMGHWPGARSYPQTPRHSLATRRPAAASTPVGRSVRKRAATSLAGERGGRTSGNPERAGPGVEPCVRA